MKLNKYIKDKLHETWPVDGIPDEDIINKWIVEWYTEIYERTPPMWLAGPTWRDRSVKNEKI
tara:strand:- start:2 stop:187 length:186 start_codon:yes stop_codon:yes gene_type:complete